MINPRTKKRMARRHFYYLPFHAWQQDLFTKTELIPHMTNDLPPSGDPPGHVRRSVGWLRKVIQNPNIFESSRIKALSFSSDGVPYFDDMGCASGWPGVLHGETLPPGAAKSEEHAHMVFLVRSFFYALNVTGQLVQRKRSMNIIIYH
jgi:hypothetical protein